MPRTTRTRTTTSRSTPRVVVVRDAPAPRPVDRESRVESSRARVDVLAVAAVAAVVVTTTAATTASAYVPGFFAAEASTATGEAPGATTSAFAHRYADPKHPGCYREIFADGVVRGEDGDPGCDGKKNVRSWALRGTIGVGDDTIFIDFSPKGGPANMVGERVDEGVRFPDGNVWRKIDP